MKRLRILCSRKKTSTNKKIEITHIGGVNATGQRWNIATQEAVKGLLAGEFQFYVVEDFQELTVTVDSESHLTLFVTGPGFLHNFLEDLPECP